MLGLQQTLRDELESLSVHLKLGLSVSEFVGKVKNVKVMEATTPRSK